MKGLDKFLIFKESLSKLDVLISRIAKKTPIDRRYNGFFYFLNLIFLVLVAGFIAVFG